MNKQKLNFINHTKMADVFKLLSLLMAVADKVALVKVTGSIIYSSMKYSLLKIVEY